ncbi:MAG: exopolyphosphatase [Calditrichaeota bacterium]|nr:exopolyphosphatase [Calditrichota bacterium]
MFRITTRADWDGLVCAALLNIVEDCDRMRFIEPGPFQSGEGEVTPDDIIANLPYRKGCALWFDHHVSNKLEGEDFRGSFWVAPSAARVIYEFYGHDESLAGWDEMIAITDRIDSASLTMDEIASPSGVILISMTVEGKRPQDEPYWRHLIKILIRNDTAALLGDPEIIRRCGEFKSINNAFKEALLKHSRLEGNVLVTDFCGRFTGEPGNRFLPYALFPTCDTWVKLTDHPTDPARAHLSVGHSIFVRTNKVVVGDLMARYGGGGHKGAGTCRPLKDDADRVLKEVVGELQHGS